MKKTILYVLGLALFITSCSDGINVEGQLNEQTYNSKTVYLYAITAASFDEPTLLETTKVENGVFSFSNIEKNEKLTGKDIPTIAFLALFDIFSENAEQEDYESLPMATLILENGKSKVEFKDNSVTVSGTKRNEEFNKMHQAITDIVSFAEKVDPMGDIEDIPTNEEGKDGRAQFQNLNNNLKDATYQITKENMQNNVGQFLFLKSYVDNMFTPNQMKDLIAGATDTFKEREDVKKLKSILEQMDTGLPQMEDDFEIELENLD